MLSHGVNLKKQSQFIRIAGCVMRIASLELKKKPILKRAK
jgi:hypothetical protein